MLWRTNRPPRTQVASGHMAPVTFVSELIPIWKLDVELEWSGTQVVFSSILE